MKYTRYVDKMKKENKEQDIVSKKMFYYLQYYVFNKRGRKIRRYIEKYKITRAYGAIKRMGYKLNNLYEEYNSENNIKMVIKW